MNKKSACTVPGAWKGCQVNLSGFHCAMIVRAKCKDPKLDLVLFVLIRQNKNSIIPSRRCFPGGKPNSGNDGAHPALPTSEKKFLPLSPDHGRPHEQVWGKSAV